MEWTKGKKVMAVICGIAILFMLYGIVHFIIMNSQYNKVIEVIKQGDYTRAEEMLTDMNVKHKDENDESVSNVDLLRRISQLEKVVYSKLR